VSPQESDEKGAVRALSTSIILMATPEETARAAAAAMWAEDRASRALGMELVSVGPGQATLRMTIREDMVNGHDIGHGGLTFTLADSVYDVVVRRGDEVVAEFVGRSREIGDHIV
jgi:acyl-coenzyme A thioesterase PaaI-like protein